MNYKFDINKYDNEFAIVQKAISLKIEEGKESLAKENSEFVIKEIDDLLRIRNLKFMGNVSELDTILELPSKQIEYSSNKSSIEFSNWEKTVDRSRRYLIEKEITPCSLNTYTMLSKSELEKIKKDLYAPFEKLEWDKWDYVFVGLAGILAILTDYFIVKIPKDMTTGIYKGQKGSIVTKKLCEFELPGDWQDKLEKFAKVPFDNTGGSDHRIETFGHDPLIGLVFGVLDIMTGRVTSFKKGGISSNQTDFSMNYNPLSALLKEFAHLLSDVATKKGLPAPLFTFLRLFKLGDFIGPTGRHHDLSSLLLWMYHNGYDLRHFITMGITPATVEIVLRGYILIRNYFEKGEENLKLGNNAKYRSMLLSAHAIACAGNAGKIILMEGNPLAFNYAEWIALVRYLLPSIKYWLVEKHRIKFDNFVKINNAGWNNIYNEKDLVIGSKYFDQIKPVYLGVS